MTIADACARDTTFSPEFVNSTVEKILVLPDGTSLLGGWFSVLQDAAFTVYNRSGITLIQSNGTVDPTFADEGGATGGGGFNRLEDIARQPDGKVIVVGEFTTFNGQSRNRIARLNADGTLDTSFNVGTGANGTVAAMLVQPDGKIIIGGYFTQYNGAARGLLARLNADGTLDTSFVPLTFGSTPGWRVESLALQPDGKILVGGSFYFSGPTLKPASAASRRPARSTRPSIASPTARMSPAAPATSAPYMTSRWRWTDASSSPGVSPRSTTPTAAASRGSPAPARSTPASCPQPTPRAIRY